MAFIPARLIPKFSLRLKAALLGVGSVLVTVTFLIILAVWQSNQYNILARSEVDSLLDADLDHITRGVLSLVQVEDQAIQEQLETNMRYAKYIMDRVGKVSFSKELVDWQISNQFSNEVSHIQLPKLLIGGIWLGKNSEARVRSDLVDSIEASTGFAATIFQRINDAGDMLRVSTTVRMSDGKRAIGTFIPAKLPNGKDNPVISDILRGDAYKGRAYVVNTWNQTGYQPILDNQKKVVGMLYVGIPETKVEARVRDAVLATTVGKSGYIYVLRGTGEARGTYVISQRGERDGESIWDATDSDGNLVIQKIINIATSLPSGSLGVERYRWINPGEIAPRWKIAKLAYYEPWDWVIGTSVYEDELLHYRAILDGGRKNMSRVMVYAGLGIAATIGLISLILAWTIVGPIQKLKEAVETIMGGNLNLSISAGSHDEVGALARSFNEMTQRLKETLEGVKKGEEKYRTIYSNAIEGLFRSSIDGELLEVNPAMARIFGYDNSEDMLNLVKNVKTHLYFDAKDRDVMIGRLREGKDVHGFEIRVIRKNKDLIWVAVSCRLIFDSNGEPKFLEGFVADINDRKQAQEASRIANEKYKSVLEAATSFSIIGTDTEGIIRVFSEGAERMLGYTSEEVVDKKTIEMFLDKIEAAEKGIVIGGLEGKSCDFVKKLRQGPDTREATYIKKDGERIKVSLTVAAIFDESKNITGYTGIARDISVEKKLEEQLVQSRKMESIGLLAGGIAHDFNNLLTPILGYTELLMIGSSSGDAKKSALRQIKDAGERAKQLTLQLLAFSRKQVIHPVVTNLGEIVSHFEGMIHRTIRENVHLEILIQEINAFINGDAGQIEQMLLNLSINAQDAMPEGGKLTLEISTIDGSNEGFRQRHPEATAESYVVLSVSDTGVGMDSKTIEHLFEPFYTTKESGRGTGLGLATVYGIVKQHNGFITVYSEKGLGTVFKIFFPQVESRGHHREEKTEERPEQAIKGSETILVAEDDPMVRALSCEMLESLGYRVMSAENPAACVELVKNFKDPINLLLSDVVMPSMNGRELYEVLKLLRPSLKVLFMSGYAKDVIGHHGVLEEGISLIQKPFSLVALSKKIRSVLDSRA